MEALGHDVTIVAAGAARHPDDSRVIRLRSLCLPPLLHPHSFSVALAEASGLVAELDALGCQRRFDIVCWMDSLWGLGLLGRPAAPRTGLMVHVLTGCEPQIGAALRQRPDVVLVPSETVIEQAMDCGLSSERWRVVPNALLLTGSSIAAPPGDVREILRRAGPIRVLARFAPDKGVVPLLQQVPAWWQRPIEAALAEASFEYYPGMHADLWRSYQASAGKSPAVRIVPPRRWVQVRSFLSEAAVVIIPSLAESFGLVALEALSVGTPVVAYAVGNLPAILGGAGVLVPTADGPLGLWLAADRLMADPDAYHAVAAEGPQRAAPFTPTTVAQMWLTSFDDNVSAHPDDHHTSGDAP